MANKDAVVAQSLECCLCFEIFTRPKLLTCAHTFCKECLDHLYECHPQRNHLSCPICRRITRINNGDVSKLQTNVLINSMVEEWKCANRSCTICDPKAKSPAVLYCAECDEYMCNACTVAHMKFKKVAKHNVVSMDDIRRGKVKVKRFCTKHPGEEKLYVCTSCNVSICFRCRVIEHGKLDHEIQEVSDYKKTIQRQIKSLQTKAGTKIATIEAHAKIVKEQQAVVKVELDQRIAEINRSYEEAVKHLRRQRNDLIAQCNQEMASHIAQLETIKEYNDKTMYSIRSASELVGNGIKALLEGQTLAVHNRIWCDMEKMLGESNPDAMQLKSIADRAKGLKFIKSNTDNSLGELRRSDWHLDEEANIFPLSHRSPNDAVPLPYGRVAVGYLDGRAIETFTVNGPQETVLRGVGVTRVSVLSDGRCVVRDTDNNIILYTQAWERLRVKFNSLSYRYKGGGMCVDRNDNIYVGYYRKNTIHVFRPEGGAPFREILCKDFTPWKMCHMNHSRRMLVQDVYDSSVRVIDDMDKQGTVLHHIKMDSKARIALLNDDSIVSAYTRGNLMSIDLYTEDLKRIRNVLHDFPMTDIIWKLFELPTGEIVVLSSDQFIVFSKFCLAMF